MNERKGIGEGGKTIKQMMEENEKLYRETGCYAGITKPHLLKEDPVKGELFHSRIMASLIAGRETTRMVSGFALCAGGGRTMPRPLHSRRGQHRPVHRHSDPYQAHG